MLGQHLRPHFLHRDTWASGLPCVNVALQRTSRRRQCAATWHSAVSDVAPEPAERMVLSPCAGTLFNHQEVGMIPWSICSHRRT